MFYTSYTSVELRVILYPTLFFCILQYFLGGGGGGGGIFLSL